MTGRLGLVLLLSGVAATLGAVGCFTADDSSNASSDIHNGDDTQPQATDSEALKSTLLLDTGCAAVKVGPRQLLLAARCVAGNTAYSPGAVLKFKIAMGATPTASDAGIDAATDDASVADAGDASVADASVPDASAPEESVSIATVNVQSSYLTACTTASPCPMGSIAAANVKDIAIVTLTADLNSVPTIPIDLDTVGTAAPLLTVGSGCAGIDGQPGQVHTTPTIAVPAKADSHFGSPFLNASTAQIHALDRDYIVTPGMGWQHGAPALCRSDIGAPLFRADKLAVAGITAGFTTYDKRTNVPVTLQHTRVDATSGVGNWLQSLGATTIRSCSGPCAQFSYDGGMPDLTPPDGWDGGFDDAGMFTMPAQGTATDLGADTNYGYSDSDPEYGDAGTHHTHTVLACSTTPGVNANGAIPILGLALAIAASRARRSASRRRG